MRIESRSYSSKIFRPAPLVYQSDDSRLLIVASAWGDSAPAQLVIDEIKKYVEAAISDVEVTSPFEYMMSLSPDANHLRIGMQIANEVLYRGTNKAEYQAAVEVTAILKTQSMLSWVQVGNPSIYFMANGGLLQPLSVEHSFDARLPARLLGLESTCHMQCGSVKVRESDRLLLMAAPQLAPAVFQLKGEEFSLNQVTREMSQEFPDKPFWAGVLQWED